MTKRKLTHILLMVLVLFTLLAFSACDEMPVEETYNDSTNGENPPIEEEPQGIMWSFDEATGTLTISGKGNMDEYESYDKVPWQEFSEQIINVVIETGVTNIGGFAFSYCSGLTSIEIPDSITSIGYYALGGCHSLTYNEKDGVKYLGNQNNPYIVAIRADESITSVILPETVKIIENDAFYNCNILTSIEIPDGVRSIGSNAFRNCISLTSITIPNSVTSIGDHAFRDCNNLTYNHKDGIKYLGNPNEPYIVAVEAEKNITRAILPPKSKFICQAFVDCKSLISIEIPNGLKSMGGFAFLGCSSLTNITIPDSVTSIGDSVFLGCWSLTSITIPDSVTSIGGKAFESCSSLTSINVPDSVTSIGRSAFDGCNSLTDINYSGTKGQWTTVVDERNSAKIPVGCTIHCTDGDIVIE